jgi:hypothetical protein
VLKELVQMGENKDSGDQKLLAGAVKVASFNMVLQVKTNSRYFYFHSYIMRPEK